MSRRCALIRRVAPTIVLVIATEVFALWGAASGSAQTPSGWTAADRALAIRTLEDAGDLTPSTASALDDAGLASAVKRFAVRELGLRVQPESIDRFWAIEPATHDVAAELAAALNAGGFGAWLASLPPPHGEYKALAAAASRYRRIAASGDWPTIPKGVALRRGQRGRQVEVLRERLAAEGYFLPSTSDPEVFDAGLEAALVSFQGHHGLTASGELSTETRAALNVTAAARADQLEANLERWRWLPHRLPPDRIEVDVAGQSVRFLQADCETLSMKSVVGDAKHRTPMFTSQVEGVTFNPPWNVPASIAKAEILPKAAKNPGYLAANDFVIVEGRLQQKAGPKSALGQIKFELPSPFGVYLHDTPAKSAFTRTRRALSHGCMRLEKPSELAALLLAPQGWTPQTVAAAISARRTQTVRLKTPVPLYVLYWTATVDPAGLVSFRPDIYGWDQDLTEALAAAGS